MKTIQTLDKMEETKSPGEFWTTGAADDDTEAETLRGWLGRRSRWRGRERVEWKWDPLEERENWGSKVENRVDEEAVAVAVAVAEAAMAEV